MQFEVEFNTEHLDRMMEVIRREIATPEEMLGSIGESLLNINRERHRQGVAPDGLEWKELSPLTSEQGNRIGGPLWKTGRMLRSFNYQVNGEVLRLGFNGGRGGKLAGFHNFGTDPYTIFPKNKTVLAFAGIFTKRVNHPGLPKRQLIGFPDSDKSLVEHVTSDHLTRILNSVR
ncbi:MAG: phage virion morphogenesis protein [Methylococcales bacterium]|nr:phage virion morphogenesis protein [Methylococcales bacterium]